MTESRLLVARSLGGRENRERLLNGVSVCGDVKVLDLDRGDVCTSL